MTYEVVVATEADRSWVVDVAAPASFKHEVNRPDLINKMQLHLLANRIIAEGTSFILLKDGERIGVIAGVHVPHMVDPGSSIVCNVFFYIAPEYRKTRGAILLLNAYRNMALELAGEGTIVLPPTAGVKHESMERLGWVVAETTYKIKKV